MIAHIPFNEEKYKNAGVKELFGEKGYSTLERNIGYRPSFDVCGIWGGYTGEGSKTVLPSKLQQSILPSGVPHQDHKISQVFADYIRSIAPDTVQVKVTPMHGGQGYVCPISLPAYRPLRKVLKSIRKNHWLCDAEEVSPFQRSNRCLALRQCSWGLD